MAKVKVTSRFQILEFLDGFIDNATASALGKTVVKEAKENISEGLSPVRGYGRFERYKDRKKYPGNRKAPRPVNLYGADGSPHMLDGYDFKIGQKKDTIEIGMVKGSADKKEIAQYHQDGTPNMAQRKLVPGDGEEWSVSIMRKISDLYSQRLAKIIRQGNKKA
jgi:hypothetical protein